MRRNDFERRRLRDLYDRNVHRVRALADARDRRRVDREDVEAPRRYIVSERRTRLEGFGRGGFQIQRSQRGRRGSRPEEQRFRDRTVFRRAGGRDRFAREEDIDREVRRERFRDRRARQGGLRIGTLQRMRRQLRARLERVGRLERLTTRGQGRGRQGNERNGGGRRRDQPRKENLDSDLANYKNEHERPRRGRGGNGRGRGKQNTLSKEGLDEELERFRGGN